MLTRSRMEGQLDKGQTMERSGEVPVFRRLLRYDAIVVSGESKPGPKIRIRSEANRKVKGSAL